MSIRIAVVHFRSLLFQFVSVGFKSPIVKDTVKATGRIRSSFKTNKLFNTLWSLFHNTLVNNDPASVVVTSFPIGPFQIIFCRNLKWKQSARVLVYKRNYSQG